MKSLKRSCAIVAMAALLCSQGWAQSGSDYNRRSYLGMADAGVSDSTWIIAFGDYTKMVIEAEVDTSAGDDGDSINVLIITQGAVGVAFWNPLDTVEVSPDNGGVNKMAWADISSQVAGYNKIRMLVKNIGDAAGANKLDIYLRIKLKK